MPTNIFRCIECGGDRIDRNGETYRCADCAASFPVCMGVPLFLSDCRVGPSGLALEPGVCEAIAGHAGLPTDQATLASVREVFASNYHLADFGLAAENNYFFERVRQAGGAPRPTLSELAAKAGTCGEARCRIERHTIPALLPNDAEMTRTVRVANTGTVVLSPAQPPVAELRYRWRRADGSLAAFGADRPTKLPVPILPGRALTVPLFLDTPPTPGEWFLDIGVTRGGEWIEDAVERVPVTIVTDRIGGTPPDWECVDRPPEAYDYHADHREGKQFLLDGLPQPLPAGYRILEIGGCCAPTCLNVPADIWNIDIDVQTLQLGKLRFMFPNVHFIACDAAKLPFRPGSFDAVVMTAALHHLADPVGCLKQFRRALRPGGRIFVLCEPVGLYYAETLGRDFRNELEAGINEQIWTAPEYAAMFRQAGLFARRVNIHASSLKAVLAADCDTLAKPEEVMDSTYRGPGLKGLVRENLRWVKHRMLKPTLGLVRVR